MDGKCLRCLISFLRADIRESTNSICKCIECASEAQVCAISSLGDTQYQIYASLASVNPMAVAAEYPEETEDSVVYHTNRVVFLEMLNPNMIVLFKQPIGVDKPTYFQDRSNYGHVITFGDKDTPAISSQLVNNYPYPALYVGNYIILNPTGQTLNDFKNGNYDRSILS